VDQDPAITPLCRETLTAAGHRVESTGGLNFEANKLSEYAPECVILNLNPVDGLPPFSLIDEIRSWFDVPLIAVSEVCTESVRVTAFERGADDYLCFPFGLREFAARIEALLRRATGPPQTRYLRIDGLHIDRAARTASLNGKALELTSKEFDILVCLARNPGVVVSAGALLGQVWGPGFVHYNQTLRVHISNIRRKTKSSCADFIRSVAGNGYVMDPPQPALPRLTQSAPLAGLRSYSSNLRVVIGAGGSEPQRLVSAK
jgi:DNA-binding response OmpR family regulator